jgi:ubiquinone/menaquinone biosynthesis C-methylase UbiE
MSEVIDYYRKNAVEMAAKYSTLDAGVVHQSWKSLLAEEPGLACDIGAGTGRDSYWLASQGWKVIAVEPVSELSSAATYTPCQDVTWLNDTLPDLAALKKLERKFDLILMSAVLMLFTTEHQCQSLESVCRLLGKGGLLVVTYKVITVPLSQDSLETYEVDASKLGEVARKHRLSTIEFGPVADQLGRESVMWKTMCFTKNND